MSTTFVIRELYEEDIASILLLSDVCSSHDVMLGVSDFSRDSLITNLTDGTHMYGLFLFDLLIGYCSSFSSRTLTRVGVYRLFKVSGKPPVAKCGYFGDCLVHPSYRGNGYQREMIAYREKVLIKDAVKYIYATVAVDNLFSSYNILSMGFIKIGTWERRNSNSRSLYIKRVGNT